MALPKQWLKGSLLLIITTAIILLWSSRETCDCRKRISYANINANPGIDLDSLYRPVDSVELSQIRTEWQQFDFRSDSSSIHQRLSYSSARSLLIVSHDKAGQRHFGAVYLPENYDSTQTYPLLLWANGLNQSDPTVQVVNNPAIKDLLFGLKNYFILIPAYRGQALETLYTRYCSDGFFGDAFDGATDDALRLLHWAKQNYPAVDTQRLALFGVSRGGTVGLLAAARYPALNCVVAQSGPTNFLSKTVARRYGKQYRYQFLSTQAPIFTLRKKIIKSSPLHFIQYYPGDLLLIYAEKDGIVPISNGESVKEKLHHKSNVEYVILKGGHSATYTQQAIQWIRQHNSKRK